MNKRRVLKRFKQVIIMISFLNILFLLFCFFIKVLPIIKNQQSLNNKIDNIKVSMSFKDLNEFIQVVDDLSKKHNVSYVIKDSNNEIYNTKSDKNLDFILYSDMFEIGDIHYFIVFFSNNKISITWLLVELLFFDIVITSFMFGSISLYAKRSVVNPVEKIISDIRNYKFGKKPIKNKLNSEFDLIQNEFVNFTDMLEESEEEQRRIIASISHDIKTPLTSIIGYSNLIKEGNITKKEIQQYNEKINNKAIHIKDILNTFDDYIVNMDNRNLKISTVKIEDLINELNDDYKIELRNNDIEFEIETDIKDVYLEMDILKIKRVFSNIISNSLRYIAEDGKIKITIHQDDIKENIIFKVVDNGTGVDEAIIGRIFEPLFTTDSSRKISGLGLSICKEFIELHSGTIRAYNCSGLAIEFTIPRIHKN